MDCETARLLGAFARSRVPELGAEEAEALSRHLAGCAACRAWQQAERQDDDRLGRAMRAVPVPADLQARIVQRLAAQRRLSRRRQWLRRGSGLAAALLLMVLGWLLWPPALIQLDLAALHHEANSRPTPAALQTVLAQQPLFHVKLHQRLQFGYPTRLNYNYLIRHGVCELQGQRVPYLDFQNGTALLRVYILDGNRFDLPAMAGTVLSGWWTIRLDLSDDGRFGWLYEYTGGSLQPFLARDILPPA